MRPASWYPSPSLPTICLYLIWTALFGRSLNVSVFHRTPLPDRRLHRSAVAYLWWAGSRFTRRAKASKRISRTSTTWTRGNGLGDGYGLKVPITFPSVPDTLLTCAGASTAPTWGCICSFLVVATIVYHRGTEWMIGTLAVTALFSSCSDRCSRVATVELSWPKQEVRNGGSYPNVCGCCLFVALLAWRCPTELGAQGFVRSAAYWFALHTPCAWLYLFVLALIRLAAYVINSVAVRHAQPSAICRLPTCGAALNTNLSRCHP
mmetsp:Transcript_18237/g.55012  ORF Transcript_18237/g.55012 Transcript_18237/m.55012 type:complete len:263 (-) Transcript_18237:125-913(-)